MKSATAFFLKLKGIIVYTRNFKLLLLKKDLYNPQGTTNSFSI